MDFKEEEPLIQTLRRNNRAQRAVVKQLRRARKHAQEHADNLFNALCEVNLTAEQALGELWGSAEFDCGPEDYEYMIKRSIEAVRKLNEIERRTNSNTSSV
jgi:hypothetical protein